MEDIRTIEIVDSFLHIIDKAILVHLGIIKITTDKDTFSFCFIDDFIEINHLIKLSLSSWTRISEVKHIIVSIHDISIVSTW